MFRFIVQIIRDDAQQWLTDQKFDFIADAKDYARSQAENPFNRHVQVRDTLTSQCIVYKRKGILDRAEAAASRVLFRRDDCSQDLASSGRGQRHEGRLRSREEFCGSETNCIYCSIISYEKSARVWVVRDDDIQPCDARIIGAVEVIPPGPEGKRAAMLCALGNDAPEIAEWVESLIEGHPDNAGLIDRAIRAGYLLAAGHVKWLRIVEGFFEAEVISSQQETRYRVWSNSGHIHCDCADWENGHAHKFGRSQGSHAPHIPGLGICCKHGLAVWLAVRMKEPVAVCPECNSSGVTGYAMVDIPGSLGLAEGCELCQGRGEVPAGWVEPLVSWMDEPLSDDDYYELQELRKYE